MKLRKINDTQVLSVLRDNAKAQFHEMAKKTKADIHHIIKRIRALEQEHGVVQRYTVLCDFTKIGFPIHCHLHIACNVKEKETLKGVLQQSAHTNNVYEVQGNYDFFCDMFFRSLQEVQHYVQELENKHNITKITTHIISKHIKKEAFMKQTSYDAYEKEQKQLRNQRKRYNENTMQKSI